MWRNPLSKESNEHNERKEKDGKEGPPRPEQAGARLAPRRGRTPNKLLFVSKGSGRRGCYRLGHWI